MAAVSQVNAGNILPQFGGAWGGGIAVDNVKFDDVAHPGPTTLQYVPPQKIGHAIGGNPIYQGPPSLRAVWSTCEIDTYQAIAVIFFGKADYPLVDLIWPDPQQAGRFIRAQAFMGWPVSTYKADGYLTASVEFFSLREIGQGYF